VPPSAPPLQGGSILVRDKLYYFQSAGPNDVGCLIGLDRDSPTGVFLDMNHFVYVARPLVVSRGSDGPV